ncbi:MAG TPA: UDP-glucose 4-epimerase GalE [Gammaproteobacteria bacterium]|nr:UDP-glucose 4-epimerase GalE [Gammaproteobacteria bacterium]
MLPNGDTILVTGGAGYIGSHTCKALASAGFNPVAYDNLVSGHRSAVRWGPFVEGDLADREALETALSEHAVSAVIHFAAHAYVGESMQWPGKYFRNNVSCTINLLEAMLSQKIRCIVFSSTCATYGMPERLPIDEAHPQRPINPYGESKLFVERALHWYGIAHGFSAASLRYFNAAGADPEGEIGERHDPETHLVPLVIETALGTRAAVDIYGTDYATPDGTAVRDYVHVTDLADAHVRALRHLRDGGESLRLNLGTGRGHSVLEVVDCVARQAGVRIPMHKGPRRPGDPAELVADAAQARAVLGWEPRYSALETIVETAWRWHAKAIGDTRRAAASARA